jgi:hypothetical protein
MAMTCIRIVLTSTMFKSRDGHWLMKPYGSCQNAQSNVREQWVSSKEFAFNAVHIFVSASFGSCSIGWASLLWAQCKIVPGDLGMPGMCFICGSIGAAFVCSSDGRDLPPSSADRFRGYKEVTCLHLTDKQSPCPSQNQTPRSITYFLCQSHRHTYTNYDCVQHYHSRRERFQSTKLDLRMGQGTNYGHCTSHLQWRGFFARHY